LLVVQKFRQKSQPWSRSMAETTPRAVRIPDDLWEAALAKTQLEGETVSEVVRRALERYVKRP
jgi:hypothetical protein